MTDQANTDLNLTPTQLQAIGLLSARWAFLETEVDFTISALGSSIEDNQSMPFNFKRRLTRWRNLANKWLKGEELKKLHEIIDRIAFIHENRGIILHGRIYGDPNKRQRWMQVDHHRHLPDAWKCTPYMVTAVQLREIAAEIEWVTQKLIEFNQKHLPSEPKALPRRYDI